MARIHLIIGPVGAGKSTYALRLADERAALRLNLDEWMAALFRPDRPSAGVMEWYVERTARCVALIGALARRLIAAGSDVVLEIGLIRRKEREELYRWVEDAGIDLTVYVLDAPRDVRRARVLRRNEEQGETFSMAVPLEFFELASDLWEPPEDDELRGRDVRLLDATAPARPAR
ncbi:MAG: ATP-binding protein [Myxococcales bacterium]|nr:ATP-binding protein [Myxococcales bacterium]